MPKSFIQFQKITRKFGKNVVLSGITLDIPKGERFGIIGVSGSGKTTMLNILIGFLRPSSGTVIFQDEEIMKHKEEVKRKFGFSTQDSSFYTKLTVMENLIYFGKLYNMSVGEIKKRAELLLRLVELSEFKDIVAGNLSIGMQCRLDLACSMMHDPEVLILDEPTEGLDPVLRKEILSLLKKINKAGTTLVVTSHLLNEMESLCTKVAILHNGQIVETGTPEKIKSKYYKNDEIHLETKPGNYQKIAKILPKTGVHKIVVRDHKIIIYTPCSEKVLRNVLRTLPRAREELVDVIVTKPSLEEVFERLTKK